MEDGKQEEINDFLKDCTTHRIAILLKDKQKIEEELKDLYFILKLKAFSEVRK